MSDSDDTTHAIFDEGDLKKYRTEIPNMVYDIGLTPYEGWLYGHFNRVCEARRELERRGLIKMEQPKGPGTSITVTIVDIWPQNMARYMTPSPREGPPSPREDRSSRGEPKKEPFKKKPTKNSEQRRKEGYEWLFDQ